MDLGYCANENTKQISVDISYTKNRGWSGTEYFICSYLETLQFSSFSLVVYEQVVVSHTIYKNSYVHQ